MSSSDFPALVLPVVSQNPATAWGGDYIIGGVRWWGKTKRKDTYLQSQGKNQFSNTNSFNWINMSNSS